MRPFAFFIPILRTPTYTKGHQCYSILQKSPNSWQNFSSRQLKTNIKLRGQIGDDQILVMDRLDSLSIFGIITFSLLIGITSQSFINAMIQGDQGLGAFLSDGNGFSNSKFKALSQKVTKVDPLPWLKLPQLDFVEVAGQDDDIMESRTKGKDDESMDRLQVVQTLIQLEEIGDIKGASKTKNYIDSLLRESETN